MQDGAIFKRGGHLEVFDTWTNFPEETQLMVCVTDFSSVNWRTIEDSNLWPLPSEGSALSS